MHRDWVPHAAEFLGTDIEGGEDVDVVADVHPSPRPVGSECSTSSCGNDVRAPEVPRPGRPSCARTLRVDGLLFPQTPRSPL